MVTLYYDIHIFFILEITATEKDSYVKGYSVPELIGSFTGGVLFGFILAVIIFKRKEIVSIMTGKWNATEKSQCPDQQYDELGMGNVSAYQDLSGPSTQNTYDQINIAYINTTVR
ncbi:uncharacterized protein LOC127717537 isoform X2 [Mytilus californianus]|uniref:uncharacterized protein LOC127717537 isoform X2 n=1 Tax=Mytilus californianus TaxID=6549 RepID=UPI002247234D|nr:uncharacterized protein LOC127717537 isoform X2 [Mytilus californianus]